MGCSGLSGQKNVGGDGLLAFFHSSHPTVPDATFADLPKTGMDQAGAISTHRSLIVCNENSIEHKLTKPYHPWTNGQAERMNRTGKEATIKAFQNPDLESLKAHVLAFVSAYNFAKHLQALRWKTPFEAVCHT